MFELATALLAGNRRALARGITAVETGGAAAHALLSAVYRHTGRAQIIGITGAPGAGKSTLVNALALHWRRTGKTLGVIAVDPTSPFSGGAILGDRIRMQPLGGDPGIFIRSMASRGRLGGIARATGDAIDLLDAAGFDLVLVETVGAGQSEVEIASSAHTTLVVEVSGMGDDVQSIKAGMLEVADLFVVNKADRPGADATVRQLRAMLHLGEAPSNGWEPPVLSAIATQEHGIAAIAEAVGRHWAFLESSGQKTMRERNRTERELQLILQEAALEQVHARLSRADWQALVTRIAARELDPYQAAADLLRRAEC